MSAPVTREEAIAAASRALIEAVRLRASRTPHEAAVAAWYPGHPEGSVADIERLIRAQRAANAAEQEQRAA